MWTIQLLGGLAARSPQRAATRFRTRKTAALLAYLAFHCRDGAQPCPREVLVELLWPETDLTAGRHNLSNALGALRHVLEPPGVQPGSVLLADRTAVSLNPAAVTTDVARFEFLARRGIDLREPEGERVAWVRGAMAEYGGRLLPGFYEEWLTPEAERLVALYLRLLRQAAPLLQAHGEQDLLLSCAHRAVADDPLGEEAVQLLMEALAAVGDSSRALRHYREFERRVREELNSQPSPELQQVAAALRSLRTKGRASSGARPALSGVETPPPLSAEPVTEEREALRGAAFASLTVTRFFDREDETRLLSELLQAPRARLVTLTGPGGTGKTRLALETARRLVGVEAPKGELPTSVTFVPLAELSDGGRVPEVLLRCLGVIPQPGRDLLEQAAEALERDRAPLLVLDNFEHLVESAAHHVSSLLGRAPRARCLVTSRQKLLIEGERELPLSPLPTAGDEYSLESLAANSSIQLFVDRAQMSRPDFQLTPHNCGVVAELCAHLEGLPLAVELAAARISVLTPTQILNGIRRDRLDFLVSRRRDALARHRTLRATLDWSYELLLPEARRLLAQLSVFRAGWTLEAAVAVTGTPEEICLELLALLRDASLIFVQDRDEGLRFMLLETVRQYATERLAASGDTDRLRRAHAVYFTELAESEKQLFQTPQHGDALVHLRRENENLRAAMEWAVEAEASEIRARLGVALFTFWKMDGYSEQVLGWFEDVVAAAEPAFRQCSMAEAVTPAAFGRVLLGLYSVLYNISKPTEAEALGRWALALTEDGSNPVARAEALRLWALHPVHGGPAGKLQVLNESLCLARLTGETSLIAAVLQYQGFYLLQVDEPEAAATANAEALALFRSLNDPVGIADVLRSRGYAGLGNSEEPDRDALRVAHVAFEENLAIRRRIGDQPGVGMALSALGQVALKERNLSEAGTILQEAVQVFEQSGWAVSIHNASALGELAILAWEQNRPTEAWAFDARAFAILMQSRYFTEAGAYLEKMALHALEAGHPARAARLVGAAERIHPLGGFGGAEPECNLPETVRRLAAVLGQKACDRERAAGVQLSNADLLEFAAGALR